MRVTPFLIFVCMSIIFFVAIDKATTSDMNDARITPSTTPSTGETAITNSLRFGLFDVICVEAMRRGWGDLKTLMRIY